MTAAILHLAFCVCVSWRRLVRAEEVYTTTWAKLFFLFFTGEEWNNMAAPLGAQIQSKKKKKSTSVA